ncbi:hypothetical protein [Planktothrix mougeotii]|uniref:hypothetical protein n=1 Tax=Planktothrix mougeotii TaxID=54306 RepID=UPI002AD36C09|nr:hypothetical protein [Planktothrix mougeotii]
MGSEKARSEAIINPVLLEVKRQLKGQVSVFSGEEFNVQPEVDLTSYVDFLISRSPEQTISDNKKLNSKIFPN